MKKKKIIQKISVICLALSMSMSIGAQEIGRVPEDVFYLLPEFREGIVYFRGQNPAQGKLNICAADNTLRFIDNDGKELAASPESAEKIIMVQIDSVQFLHNQDGFYRKYPVTPSMGIALKRVVNIMRGAKKGAFGIVDQTSSIRQYSTLYSDGMTYNLNTGDPYEVSETLYLYVNQAIVPLTKKNLKKVFPDRKEDIDSWFRSGNYLPKTVSEALPMLRQWAK